MMYVMIMYVLTMTSRILLALEPVHTFHIRTVYTIGQAVSQSVDVQG